MKKKILAALLAAASMLCTGCFDKVELESRGFVISIGVDKFSGDKKTGNRFAVTMALPNVAVLLDKGGGADKKAKSVKTESSETIAAAMKMVDSKSSQTLYYGLSKMVLISEGVLKDSALFRETIDAFERNREISRKIIVMASGEPAEEILNADVPGEPMVGLFAASYYKNNVAASTFKQDLEHVVGGLRSTGNTVIPKVEVKEKEIKLGGLAVIKDYKLAGWLDDHETRGYLLATGRADNAVIITEYNGTFVPLKVSGYRSKISFYEDVNGLNCVINVNAEGTVDEYRLAPEAESGPTAELSGADATETLTRQYQEIIADDILKVLEKFEKEFKMDGLNFKDELRKHNYKLYNAYQDVVERNFADVPVYVDARVEITSTGAIK